MEWLTYRVLYIVSGFNITRRLFYTCQIACISYILDVTTVEELVYRAKKNVYVK